MRGDQSDCRGAEEGHDDTPTKHLRSFRWNLNQWGTWNFGGDRLDLAGNDNAELSHFVRANDLVEDPIPVAEELYPSPYASGQPGKRALD